MRRNGGKWLPGVAATRMLADVRAYQATPCNTAANVGLWKTTACREVVQFLNDGLQIVAHMIVTRTE